MAGPRRHHYVRCSPAAAGTSTEVQNAHRRALIGMVLRHSGQVFVVGSGGACPCRSRAISVFIGSTTQKYTAAAIRKNETTLLMKSPISNSLPCSELDLRKLGLAHDRGDQRSD